MELKQIAKNIHEKLEQSGADYYVGTDNVWGLALAFGNWEEITNHPQYQDGEALCAAFWKIWEEWSVLMDEHDMWPVVETPENFVFELPNKLH